MNDIEEKSIPSPSVSIDSATPAAQKPDEANSLPFRPADVPLMGSVLPRHVAGGFTGVAEELDRRSRDWSMMVRLLEQQRLQLETSENERERLNAELELVLPDVRASTRALTKTVARTKTGDVSGNLSALFVENLHNLDRLENLARALTANLLWTRSSWEQYARSVIGAEKMRSELKS